MGLWARRAGWLGLLLAMGAEAGGLQGLQQGLQRFQAIRNEHRRRLEELERTRAAANARNPRVQGARPYQPSLQPYGSEPQQPGGQYPGQYTGQYPGQYPGTYPGPYPGPYPVTQAQQVSEPSAKNQARQLALEDRVAKLPKVLETLIAEKLLEGDEAKELGSVVGNAIEVGNPWVLLKHYGGKELTGEPAAILAVAMSWSLPATELLVAKESRDLGALPFPSEKTAAVFFKYATQPATDAGGGELRRAAFRLLQGLGYFEVVYGVDLEQAVTREAERALAQGFDSIQAQDRAFRAVAQGLLASKPLVKPVPATYREAAGILVERQPTEQDREPTLADWLGTAPEDENAKVDDDPGEGTDDGNSDDLDYDDDADDEPGESSGAGTDPGMHQGLVPGPVPVGAPSPLPQVIPVAPQLPTPTPVAVAVVPAVPVVVAPPVAAVAAVATPAPVVPLVPPVAPPAGPLPAAGMGQGMGLGLGVLGALTLLNLAMLARRETEAPALPTAGVAAGGKAVDPEFRNEKTASPGNARTKVSEPGALPRTGLAPVPGAQTVAEGPKTPATAGARPAGETAVVPAGERDGLPAWLAAALAKPLGDRYSGLRVLGAGGMGTVVAATDTRLGRKVAIKVPPPHLSASQHFQARFLREARALASLDHEHIARVHDVPTVPDGEVPVMIMELLEGTDLATLLAARKEFEPAQVVRWMIQAASGLAHAHGHGVLHRDIKPANMMVVTGGKLKVLDFGLAGVDDGAPLTQSGMIMGSLPYMPPEQLRGEKVDHTADLYSLAVSAFELLTGTLPFDPEDRARQKPASVLARRPGLPAGLEGFFARGLAADRAARFPSAGEFAKGLVAAVKGGASAPG